MTLYGLDGICDTIWFRGRGMGESKLVVTEHGLKLIDWRRYHSVLRIIPNAEIRRVDLFIFKITDIYSMLLCDEYVR